MKGLTSFLLGVLVGALGVAVYRRVEERMEDESESELAERMSRHLEELESRTRSDAAKSKPAAPRKPASKVVRKKPSRK